MSVKAVQREVHLSKRRLSEQFMPIFCDQRTVCCDIDLEPLLVAQIEQLIDLRVEQRLPFDMQINVFGVRFDLIQSFRKIIYGNEVGLALRRRAKGTGEIADAGNFDIYFFKDFQDFSPSSMVI